MAKEPKKKSKAPEKSARPQARPTLAPKKSVRPTARPANLADGAAVNRGNRAREQEQRESEGLRPPKKMAGGGKCRGMGKAAKGGKYSRSM